MLDKLQWDNSPELRERVYNELANWGAWSKQGGRVYLNYPDHANFTNEPRRDPPPVVDPDLAEWTERVFRYWRTEATGGQRPTFVLKLKYLEDRPLEKICYDFHGKFKVKRRNSEMAAFIDEAEWFYALLSQELREDLAVKSTQTGQKRHVA